MMHLACSISSAVSASLMPEAPFFSTFREIPISFALRSKDSAAIYVCAIPVGQPVTANTSKCGLSTDTLGTTFSIASVAFASIASVMLGAFSSSVLI